MGKPSTLKSFQFELIIDKLNPLEGFSIRAETRENMILIFVEDLREHPDFKGRKPAYGWNDIFQTLSRIGLDPAKAVVSLGFRTEAVNYNSGETFNIGVAQLGWTCAIAPRHGTHRSGTCLRDNGKLVPKLLVERAVRLMVLVRAQGFQDQHPFLGRETGPLLAEGEDA